MNVHHVHAVPIEARRGWQIVWNPAIASQHVTADKQTQVSSKSNSAFNGWVISPDPEYLHFLCTISHFQRSLTLVQQAYSVCGGLNFHLQWSHTRNALFSTPSQVRFHQFQVFICWEDQRFYFGHFLPVSRAIGISWVSLWLIVSLVCSCQLVFLFMCLFGMVYFVLGGSLRFSLTPGSGGTCL